MELPKTSICLITRSQALFEAFAVADSLPLIDNKWIEQINVSLQGQGTISARAWLGRGPLSYRLGSAALLFFEHGEEDYPVFTYPSEGPRGAAVKGSTVTQNLAAGENTSVFCLEAIATVPVAPDSWDQVSKNEIAPELQSLAQNYLTTTRGILDTLVGAYALYQYPLVWKPIYDRHLYLFVNTDTHQSTNSAQPVAADNFIPFRLNASKRISEGRFSDAVIERAVDVVKADLKEPLIFLKDSLWHSDIRTRFLLQFWIVEYLAEKHTADLPRDDDMRGFVNAIEDIVARTFPSFLERFRTRKGEFLSRTLVERVAACCEVLRIQYEDTVFKRAKRVRDSLSHGTAYDAGELALMELYIRELSRHMLRRALESRGVFLTGDAKPLAELPIIVPMFIRQKNLEMKTASFTLPPQSQ